MIILSGADLVLPDRVISGGSLILEHDRIVEIRPPGVSSPAGSPHVRLADHYIVPGFIDVHVHGIEGCDTLDGAEAVETIAARLPRYGVTAFCPTTVACPPAMLRQLLAAVRQARGAGRTASARVLPAHLESNFINPEFRGAQPASCLRHPPTFSLSADVSFSKVRPAPADVAEAAEFTAGDVLAEIERAASEVGIVTLAPELPGAIGLVEHLVARSHRVSLGHSGASFEQALAGVAAGARHATHLFNRMPPLHHRDPGLAGAILRSEEVAAELICDGLHVHPAMARIAIAAKGPARVMAITDGTAGAGLPPGARARLGGQEIHVGDAAAYLPDGTLAGSTLTMDRAFRLLVEVVKLPLVTAAFACATTAARELRLPDCGELAPGAIADLAVLDRRFRVVRTYVGGELVFSAEPGA